MRRTGLEVYPPTSGKEECALRGRESFLLPLRAIYRFGDHGTIAKN
jgi:hypothetical protein